MARLETADGLPLTEGLSVLDTAQGGGCSFFFSGQKVPLVPFRDKIRVWTRGQRVLATTSTQVCLLGPHHDQRGRVEV